MSVAVSFAEIDGQHVELLPARTVMSLHAGIGVGGAGGPGQGGVGVGLLNVNVLGTQSNPVGNGIGGAGGWGVDLGGGGSDVK
jgi:hypothetical protein